MDPLVPMLHAVSSAASAALVMGVAEGVALTIAVSVLLRLCPGLSASVRSAVWTVALGISILLPAGSLLRTPGKTQAGQAAAQVGEGWAMVLVAIWVVLSAARLTLLVAGAIRLRQVWRRAVPFEAGTECRKWLATGGRQAELCLSEDVDRPSVVGFLRPRVLLPAAQLKTLAPAEIEHIVRHEMEHLQRRDDWTNLAQKLSLAIFPVNPVLFWLDRRLCRERELACDDGVLRQTGAPKTYAACLASLAENRLATKAMLRRGGALLLGAWGRETELSRRVLRILSWRDTALGRRSNPAVAGVLMIGVAAIGLELARCPDLLRFTNESASFAEVGLAVVGSPSGDVILPATAQENGSAVKPMLVKAVLPMQARVRPRAAAQSNKESHARSAQRILRSRISRKVKQIPPRQTAQRTPALRVLMTDWPAELPARLVLTVAGEDRSGASVGDDVQQYAAFATREGWFVIQL